MSILAWASHTDKNCFADENIDAMFTQVTKLQSMASYIVAVLLKQRRSNVIK